MRQHRPRPASGADSRSWLRSQIAQLALAAALALNGCGQVEGAAVDEPSIGAPSPSSLAPSEPTARFNPCFYGYEPQPNEADANMPEILAWLSANGWQAAHVEWHAIRSCSAPGELAPAEQSQVDICRFRRLVPKDQHCQSNGDGYQFLVFHRYLLQAVRQLWPSHSAQLAGFKQFPSSEYDVPTAWRAAWKSWGADVRAAGKLADAIAKPENLAKFPSEGALGRWLQCNVGSQLWAPPEHPRGASTGEAAMDNYMFWKLHGWMDNVWEKYRTAKGLTPTNQQLRDDLAAQCQELHTEIRIVQQGLGPQDVADPAGPLPAESGFFHEQVRPIFASQTNLCVSCHAETGTNANLRLGGHITSRELVAGLVNRATLYGGQYRLVVPGDPEHSWLYLKAAGTTAAANCQASDTAPCISGVMPPVSGPTLTEAERRTLFQWIAGGAEGPP